MNHKHAWPVPKECVALADDVCAWKTSNGFMVAFAVEGEDRRQVGGIAIGPNEWQIVSGSLNDGNLTVTPSLDWHRPPYRRHGWIRDGKWVEA